MANFAALIRTLQALNARTSTAAPIVIHGGLRPARRIFVKGVTFTPEDDESRLAFLTRVKKAVTPGVPMIVGGLPDLDYNGAGKLSWITAAGEFTGASSENHDWWGGKDA
jgi:hypothetical protein